MPRTDSWIQDSLNNSLTGIKHNAALSAVLLVLYGARGFTFDGLGQLIALALSLVCAQILIDGFYVVRKVPRPVSFFRRHLPSALLTIIFFGSLLFLLSS